jgi:chromosomal replication initiation ATPase DnaA
VILIHEQEMGDVRAASARAQLALYRLRVIGAEATAHRIAREHGVDLMIVLDNIRDKSISGARQHLAAVLRWTTDMSYPEVGAVLGIDHTSVMAAEVSFGARLEESDGRPGDWMKKDARRRAKNKSANTKQRSKV